MLRGFVPDPIRNPTKVHSLPSSWDNGIFLSNFQCVLNHSGMTMKLTLGHSLVRSLVHSHRTFIHFLRTACFACVLCCALLRSFVRSLTRQFTRSRADRKEVFGQQRRREPEEAKSCRTGGICAYAHPSIPPPGPPKASPGLSGAGPGLSEPALPAHGQPLRGLGQPLIGLGQPLRGLSQPLRGLG